MKSSKSNPGAALQPALLGVLLTACFSESEQSVLPTARVTLEDYQRAEQFLTQNTELLVYDAVLARYWQQDDRLVYQKRSPKGLETLIVDPVSGSRTAAYEPAVLAAALSTFTEDAVTADDLLLSAIEIAEDQQFMAFDYADCRYTLTLADGAVFQQAGESPAQSTEGTSPQPAEGSPCPADTSHEFLSPDGSRAAFIAEHNLWLRDTTTNTLTQLTFDGVEHYGYATNNAGWLRDAGPVLLWSPDSRKIATFRHDSRQVGEMFLYTTEVGHSELDSWKYPLPGDEHIFMIERVVIQLEPEPHLVWLDMPADYHRSSVTDHVADREGRLLDVEWSEDSRTLAFVSTSRDHQSATLRIADPHTGAVRDVYQETVATWFESGSITPNWRVLHQRNEFLWFSERDNWGHLYLHDLTTGELKHQLTSGNWRVLQVQQVDLENAQVYFTASNRESIDPYFQHLYRIDLDGTDLTLLTPEAAHHEIDWSQSGEYFTDVYSTPVDPPVAVIRNQAGERLLELEQADIAALLATGWVAPEPFRVKARDQQTDLFGLLYKPTDFTATGSYPVLNYLYPGPQTGSVGSRSFAAARRDKQALAELGFVVVEVDAMGTPGRSKSFHDVYYGNMGDNGLPDQVTTIRQLAANRPWMDLERIGIWGHSGGGFAAAAGLLRYPDFYKVAVSSAGNHDNRNYEDDWGEKWQGLLEVYPETTATDVAAEPAAPGTNYDNQANQLLADQLQGKLLLAHGLLDDNVPPTNTLLLVQALIDAEKDFDLLLLPEARHGFANTRYFMRRRWDYFVEHLLGVSPPAGFRFADNIP